MPNATNEIRLQTNIAFYFALKSWPTALKPNLNGRNAASTRIGILIRAAEFRSLSVGSKK